MISCGAYVHFADKVFLFGTIMEATDKKVRLIPDFISNCGMARVFAYLMSNDLGVLTDQGIFEDTSSTIRQALQNTYNKNSAKTGIAKSAFEIALNQLI
mgnify:CR=1 FL=1